MSNMKANKEMIYSNLSYLALRVKAISCFKNIKKRDSFAG